MGAASQLGAYRDTRRCDCQRSFVTGEGVATAMATVRFYRGHWVADYYDANKRRRIERPEGHFEKGTQELHAAQVPMGGKVVGSVHRVVSADGKMLTVRNKGTHADGKTYDDTLIYDKQ
jgi:hypothetical protein